MTDQGPREISPVQFFEGEGQITTFDPATSSNKPISNNRLDGNKDPHDLTVRERRILQEQQALYAEAQRAIEAGEVDLVPLADLPAPQSEVSLDAVPEPTEADLARIEAESEPETAVEDVARPEEPETAPVVEDKPVDTPAARAAARKAARDAAAAADNK